jgi:hypothetical protein
MKMMPNLNSKEQKDLQFNKKEVWKKSNFNLFFKRELYRTTEIKFEKKKKNF